MVRFDFERSSVSVHGLDWVAAVQVS
jgi:hypothetical protein